MAPLMFQFTLPRGERRENCRQAGATEGGSIHAPAGGATPSFSASSDSASFQFTLPRGERHRARLDRTGDTSFNSRSRGGSDLICLLLPQRPLSFNSRSRGGSDRRTPTRGWCWPRFNSRSRGGSDTPSRPRASSSKAFQFTLPRGERPRPSSGRARRCSFNSRSRGGSDLPVFEKHIRAGRFQFTLPRGERLWLRLDGRELREVSIHAPAGGATTLTPADARRRWCFNSRSRGGSDIRFLRELLLRQSFNSRSRGGSDFVPNRLLWSNWQFQFTLPRGERRVGAP